MEHFKFFLLLLHQLPREAFKRSIGFLLHIAPDKQTAEEVSDLRLKN